MLLRTEDVTVSRANLIARTELAKANSDFTRANAGFIGASAYIWRTVKDEAVRESHSAMEGEIVKYDNEPTLSDGETGHAGTFPNCRCYQEVIIEVANG